MKIKVLEKKLLTAGHSTIWAYFFDGKEIGESEVGKKIKTYCKNKLAGKVKYQLYVSSNLSVNVRKHGDFNAVKFFKDSVENEMVLVEKEFTSQYDGGKWKAMVLVPLKEIESAKGADVADYAVTPEAFEIAVQAEIANAEINAHITNPTAVTKFEIGRSYTVTDFWGRVVNYVKPIKRGISDDGAVKKLTVEDAQGNIFTGSVHIDDNVEHFYGLPDDVLLVSALDAATFTCNIFVYSSAADFSGADPFRLLECRHFPNLRDAVDFAITYKTCDAEYGGAAVFAKNHFDEDVMVLDVDRVGTLTPLTYSAKVALKHAKRAIA